MNNCILMRIGELEKRSENYGGCIDEATYDFLQFFRYKIFLIKIFKIFICTNMILDSTLEMYNQDNNHYILRCKFMLILINNFDVSNY